MSTFTLSDDSLGTYIERDGEIIAGPLLLSSTQKEHLRAAFEGRYAITPMMLAVAWKTFRGNRHGLLLSPGPAFKEALEAALRQRELELTT